MTKKSLPTPHQEFLENDEKANELFDFVCAELAATENNSPRHHKFYVASKVHTALETYYFACALLDVFDKTPITKIDFDFSDEYDDQGGSYLSTSIEVFYTLKKRGKVAEEKSCSLYSSDVDDMNDDQLLDFLTENTDAYDALSHVAEVASEWQEDDVGDFHETIFDKDSVLPAYKKSNPEIYAIIEKFILSNFVAEVKEKAPKRSISKM